LSLRNILVQYINSWMVKIWLYVKLAMVFKSLRNQDHFSLKKHSKLPFLLSSPKKTQNLTTSRILYFTCLRSCGKNFMKFDLANWEILAFKVGKKEIVLNTSLQFQMTLTAICGNLLHYALWIFLKLFNNWVEVS